MPPTEIYASVGKVGPRYYWIVTNSWGSAKSLAEGFATTKDDAESKIAAAAAKLGIEPCMSAAYHATGFYKYFRANKRTGTSAYREVPEAAEFQGSPYLWSPVKVYHPDGKRLRWLRHMITRVTAKYVFISDVNGVEPDAPDPDRSNIADLYVRLSRSDLEQQGWAAGRICTWHTDVYFTASGRAEKCSEIAA